MTSSGYWVNNEHIVFKNAIKPCKFCGFCPYGQLVEEFPLSSISRAEAIKHQEYMIKALADGTFDKPNPEYPYLMTRKDAITEIDEFDAKDYPENPLPVDKMACKVFGHHCPVYYHAELLAEEDEITQEEIDVFNTEMNEYMKKIENYHEKDDE